MKITFQTNQLSHRASSHDLRFLDSIRDKNVEVFEELQKQKIETLLKFRDVKKNIELYDNTLEKYSSFSIPEEILILVKKNLDELKLYRNTLEKKLREINLSILAEEEKNY